MCVTINRYQHFIERIEQEINPAVSKALAELKSEKNGADFVEKTVHSFETEFRLLEFFEKNFVFPSVLSLFKDSYMSEGFLNNISEIISLTNRRTNKLNAEANEMRILSGYVEDHVRINQKLSQFSNIFYNQFWPEREIWKRLLSRLEYNSIPCDNNGKCKCGDKDRN